VAPYVRETGVRSKLTGRLSEESATRASVARTVDRLAERMREDGIGGLLCSHRPVLPMLYEHLGVEDPSLDPGEMLVVHLRDGTVRATERHPLT